VVEIVSWVLLKAVEIVFWGLSQIFEAVEGGEFPAHPPRKNKAATAEMKVRNLFGVIVACAGRGRLICRLR